MNSYALEIIRDSEQYREFAYPDPASALMRACARLQLKFRWGFVPAATIFPQLPDEVVKLSPRPWTCGYGETEGVDIETRMTMDEAEARLQQSVQEKESEVLSRCTVKPNENQLGAMTSLAYNIGIGNFSSSTVLRSHNKSDFAAATQAFKLFNKAGGQVMNGLVKRRAREAALYAKLPTDLVAAVEDRPTLPQTVDREVPLTQSNINRASVVAGGTAAVAAANQVLDAVNSLKTGVEGLGQWFVPVLLVAVVLLCAYIIWERYDARRKGSL